jgi:hydroxymethylglutaryl-CoA reductase (NADPH)
MAGPGGGSGRTGLAGLAAQRRAHVRDARAVAGDGRPQRRGKPALVRPGDEPADPGELIDGVGDWWAELEQMPRTLVHNDFSPRNIALRATDHSLVAYDWELATLHVPQRDLAELLAFVLTDKAAPDEVTAMVETHRAAVQGVSGSAIDRERWRRGYRLALWDFVITRLQLYVMAHTHRELPFLEHVVPTALRLLEIEDEEAGRGM